MDHLSHTPGFQLFKSDNITLTMDLTLTQMLGGIKFVDMQLGSLTPPFSTSQLGHPFLMRTSDCSSLKVRTAGTFYLPIYLSHRTTLHAFIGLVCTVSGSLPALNSEDDKIRDPKGIMCFRKQATFLSSSTTKPFA